jgi:enamine deaminase RidA (YjgF/YER057c/UK114 family)
VGFVQGHAVGGGGRTIYCSGQTSVDADGNPVHEGDIAAQMTQALDNVEAVLRESGVSLSDVVRLNSRTQSRAAAWKRSGLGRLTRNASASRAAATTAA